MDLGLPKGDGQITNRSSIEPDGDGPVFEEMVLTACRQLYKDKGNNSSQETHSRFIDSIFFMTKEHLS